MSTQGMLRWDLTFGGKEFISQLARSGWAFAKLAEVSPALDQFLEGAHLCLLVPIEMQSQSGDSNHKGMVLAKSREVSTKVAGKRRKNDLKGAGETKVKKQSCSDLNASMKSNERAIILEALRTYDWNYSVAAEQLGMSERSIFNKIRPRQVEEAEVEPDHEIPILLGEESGALSRE